MSVSHVVADVAHQHQAAAAQGQFAAAGGVIDAILVQPAGFGAAALGEAGGQVAAHQAQPVAVDAGLVLGVDGGDANPRSPGWRSAPPRPARRRRRPHRPCRSDGRGRSGSPGAGRCGAAAPPSGASAAPRQPANWAGIGQAASRRRSSGDTARAPSVDRIGGGVGVRAGGQRRDLVEQARGR